MRAALAQFEENIRRVRDLDAIAIALRKSTTPALDLSDIFRTEIVMVVSALDHFVHEMVRVGMVQCQLGERPATDAFLRFRTTLASVRDAIADPASTVWLDQAIRQAHSWQSFQDPDKLADAIRLIYAAKLWEEVAARLSTAKRPVTAGDIKTSLSAIIDRRNKIAHEADLDPASPGSRWPISASMARETVTYIRRVGIEIFKVVA